MTGQIRNDIALVLQEWSVEKVAKAKSILEYRQANASRQLTQSIQPTNVVVDGSTISIGITAEDYYIFVDEGVRGIGGSKLPMRKNTGKYSFKTPFVSKSMVNNIQDWIASKGVQVRQTQSQKTKDVIKQSFSLAYVFARSIKKRGLEATYFWSDTFNEKAYNELAQKIADKLGKGYDIEFKNI